MHNQISEYMNAVFSIYDAEKDKKRFIANILEDKLVDILDGHKVTIATRVKTKESLKEKIIRKKYYVEYEPDNLINNLVDFIGVKVLCLLNSDEIILFEKIKNDFCFKTSDQYYTTNNYSVNDDMIICLKEPGKEQNQANGLPIYRIDGKVIYKGEEHLFELQIKSSVNSLWSEVEHVLFYKNYRVEPNSGFYKEMMDSFRYGLDLLDRQLQLMYSRLNSTINHVNEFKEMFSRIAYNILHEGIEQIQELHVDLRKAYKYCVEYYFSDCGSYEEIANKADKFINKIYSIRSNLKYEVLNRDIEYKRSSSATSSLVDYGCKVISSVAQIDPILKTQIWLLLMMEEGSKQLECVVENLISAQERKYSDELDISDFFDYDDSRIIIYSAINIAVLKCAQSLKGIDIFFEGIYNKNAHFIISEFIIKEMSNLAFNMENRKEEYEKHISNILYCRIMIMCEKVPSTEIIDEIKNIEYDNYQYIPDYDYEWLKTSELNLESLAKIFIMEEEEHDC